MGYHQPLRLCVGCRQRTESQQLVRVALDRSTDVPSTVLDHRRTMMGRGAWVHPEPECLTTALRRKAFHQAFKQRVDTQRLDTQFAEMKKLRDHNAVAKTQGVQNHESGSEI